MVATRRVGAETLDGLVETDPAAQRSRRDLQRVHLAMGTRAILLRGLRSLREFSPLATARPAARLRILELGAGDGSLMLGVARELAPAWPAVELTLLDRQALVGTATVASYAALGWAAVPLVADVLDWAAAPAADSAWGAAPPRWDLIVTSLFLHHFEGKALEGLMAAISARGDHFFACEPRRAWLALAGSHLVGALGANSVTRRDAVTSVHAGFRGHELTALWPARGGDWWLREFSAGAFSHCFSAEPARAT